jgi:hypothetical protein
MPSLGRPLRGLHTKSLFNQNSTQIFRHETIQHHRSNRTIRCRKLNDKAVWCHFPASEAYDRPINLNGMADVMFDISCPCARSAR